MCLNIVISQRPVNTIACNIGTQSALQYLFHLVNNYNNYKSRVDFFPSSFPEPKTFTDKALIQRSNLTLPCPVLIKHEEKRVKQE